MNKICKNCNQENSDFVGLLLCSKCNVGLGLFDDSIEELHKAIFYLKKHKSAFLPLTFVA